MNDQYEVVAVYKVMIEIKNITNSHLVLASWPPGVWKQKTGQHYPELGDILIHTGSIYVPSANSLDPTPTTSGHQFWRGPTPKQAAPSIESALNHSGQINHMFNTGWQIVPAPTRTEECAHDWKETMGFNRMYRDCIKCGIKGN